MKFKSMKFKSTALLFAASFAAATSSHAATVANWKVLSAVSPLTVGGVTSASSGLNTNSPVFGTGTNGMDGVGAAGRFGTTASPESVTLSVGETLTVSATVTLTSGLSNISGHYRFAVLDDNGQFAADSVVNWAGGWNHTVAGSSSISSASLFQASTGTLANYMSTLNTGDNNAVNLTPTVSRTGTFNGASATAYTWTMSITRDSATTVDLVSSFIGGPSSYSETYTKNDVTTSVFTYNAIGIQTTVQTDLDRLTISGAQYSVIPEPSTAMLGGLGLLALLLRRRH